MLYESRRTEQIFGLPFAASRTTCGRALPGAEKRQRAPYELVALGAEDGSMAAPRHHPQRRTDDAAIELDRKLDGVERIAIAGHDERRRSDGAEMLGREIHVVPIDTERR